MCEVHNIIMSIDTLWLISIAKGERVYYTHSGEFKVERKGQAYISLSLYLRLDFVVKMFWWNGIVKS